jgi:hypothetical protein
VLRWIAVVLLVAVASGCGDSESSRESPPSTETAGDTGAATSTDPDRPPTSVDELLARLPPLDEPASEEVDAYRRAAFEAFFGHCVNAPDTVKEAFVGANRALLDKLPLYPQATFVQEFHIDHRDGNGCPEGMGPPTSYSTYRTYRLPRAASAREIIRFYERELAGWRRTYAATPTQCEQGFRRGEQLLGVRACSTGLTLTASALGRQEPEQASPAKLPPRPFGARYPVAEGYGDLVEPSGYEAEAGDSCERIASAEGASLIIPPAPGVRAELRNEPLKMGSGTFDRYVLVEWSFERIQGDCPPTEIHLTLVNPNPAMPPLSIPVDVRARSGVARLPVLDSFAKVSVLRATAGSVDGARSRSVAVLITR